MRKRRCLILLLAVMFLINFSACSSKNEKGRNVDNTKGNSTLKIYYTTRADKIPPALNIFREKYKNVDVEEKFFTDVNEYRNKITMDLLSCEGPDVILICPETFGSVNKLSQRGVFCDLNELIKKDRDFKMSDYNEKILNSFEQDGKRYVVPLNYALCMLVTSKEALEKNDIKIDRLNWNHKELVKIAEKHAANSKVNKKYLLNFNFSIGNLVWDSGISFVDYKNRKSMFSSQEFIEILEVYKKLNTSICPEQEIDNRAIDNILKNNVFIMSIDNFASINNLFSSNSLYKSIGEEMEVYPFPMPDRENKGLVSHVQEAVAVNSQSKNKEAAFNFIKILLSEEIQKVADKGYSGQMGVPVNKKAYESDFEHFMGGYEKVAGLTISMSMGGYSYSPAPLPKEYKSKLDSILSKINKCEIHEGEISNIISEEMPDFIEGKKTAAQTAKVIDDKVNLYLNE